MKVIDILNHLEEQGYLTSLYQAGTIGLSAYAHRDIYLRWQTLRASMRYEEDNAGAVRLVAQELEVSIPTVYRAVAAMGKVVQST